MTSLKGRRQIGLISKSWIAVSALVAAVVVVTLAGCPGGGGGPGGGLASTPWPKFQNGANNNGVSTANSVSGTIQAKFSFPSGGESFDPAIGPDGTIYVGHQQGPTGSVYALSGQGLAQKWVFPLDISGPLDFPGVFISAPAIGADGTIYVAAGAGTSGRAYALDPGGKMRWEVDLGSVASGSPTIGKDGTVFVPAGQLFALNGLTGQQVKPPFSPDASSRISSPALDSKGILYIGADKVYALDSASWQVLWKFALQGPDNGCQGQPAASGFFGAPAIDESYPNMYVWANITCPASSGQLFGSSFGRVYDLAPATGQFAWSLRTQNGDTGGSSLSSPIYGVKGSPCTIYCVVAAIGVLSQQFVYAAGPFDSNWQWGPQPFAYAAVAYGVHSPIAASDGTIYLSTANGLFTLDPNSGNTRWSVQDGVGNPSGGAAIGSDGTVYVGGFSAFYAIH